MKRLFFAIFLAVTACAATAQEVTIQSTCAPNGITGRAPDTLYPRKTHSISGPGTPVHLFARIESFFDHELVGPQ